MSEQRALTAGAPVLELTKHDISEHSESGIYGVNHVLSFQVGEIQDPQNFHMGMAIVDVGGVLRDYQVRQGTVSSFFARLFFPRSSESEIRSLLITPQMPSNEDLELMSSGLIDVLASRLVDPFSDNH